MHIFRRFWRALVGGPLPNGSETNPDPLNEANAVYVVCSLVQCPDGENVASAMDAKEQEISCLAMADKVSQFSPQLAQLYHGRGLHCRGEAKYDDAIADCTVAIGLDPSLAKAYANRAVAYGMKGDNDKAIDDFTEAIRLESLRLVPVVKPGEAAWAEEFTVDRRSFDSLVGWVVMEHLLKVVGHCLLEQWERRPPVVMVWRDHLISCPEPVPPEFPGPLEAHIAPIVLVEGDTRMPVGLLGAGDAPVSLHFSDQPSGGKLTFSPKPSLATSSAQR